MKHLFIPYELALLAKEKGFNDYCLGHYRYNKEFTTSFDTSLFQIPAPLYQQIADWFRIIYDIHIHISRVYEYSKSPRTFSGWCVYIDNGIEDSNLECNKIFINTFYSDYNEALNKAIEEAFKLI